MTGAQLKPGDLVGGKYRLEKLLGQGAMGTVWAARNQHTDRAFAIKFMLPQYAKDTVLVQRFLNEARICGRLEHPSLVEIYDLGRADELDGAPFLVMELLRGEGLERVLQRATRMPATRIVPIVYEICQALDLAHRAGVVHRDIKPGNIFLHRTRDGHLVPKLLDFGVSKASREPDEPELTKVGVVLGSPLYMSPEQATAMGDIDARSDIWGLGVMLYQALTGQVPFNATTYNAVLSAILTQRHKSARELVPGVPAKLSDLIDQCLVKDRNRRLQTVTELASRLEDLMLEMAGEDEPAPSSMLPVRRSVAPAEVVIDVPEAPEERTEVMTRESLDPAIIAAMLGEGGATPQRPARQRTPEPPPSSPDLDEEALSQRSTVLRRQWLADLAEAVSTAKTDDIVDRSPGGDSDRALRVKQVAMRLQEVEDVAEPPMDETARALKMARAELGKSGSALLPSTKMRAAQPASSSGLEATGSVAKTSPEGRAVSRPSEPSSADKTLPDAASPRASSSPDKSADKGHPSDGTTMPAPGVAPITSTPPPARPPWVLPVAAAVLVGAAAAIAYKLFG